MEEGLHLIANLLLAVPAFDGMLDDRVIGKVLVKARQAIQRQPNPEEVYEFVYEDSVGQGRQESQYRLQLYS